MSDGSLPDRLTQLRSRWEADPASRIFLQLAEEYRHQGRLQEALGVLDQGLREHPGYLSALVAKGRCLLELGQPEPAREVLERVVRQDATQMVANKLLVRTYLETGQAARARERLDLYSLLHDGDPEIEDLRSRIQRLDGAPAGGSRLPSAAPGSGGSAEGDVFDLAAPSRAAAPRGASPSTDVFDLRPPAAPVPSTVAVSPPSPAPAPPPAPVADEGDEDESEPVAAGEPFAGLVSRAVRRRHFTALVAEGIFAFEPPAWAAAAPAAPPVPVSERAEPEPEIAAHIEKEPEQQPEPEPEPEIEKPPEAAPPAAAPAAAPGPPAAPAWAAGGEVATATLGELYLRQGHASEAERIFGEVVLREPGNAAAHEGLARARDLREPARESAAAPESPEESAAAPALPAPIPLDRKAKKMQALSSYLDRIRRGSGRHVS